MNATETKVSHTPGPWSWEIDERNKYLYGKSPIPCVVASSVKEKDAKLIAAAPELLAACKRAINVLNGHASGGYVGMNADGNYVYEQAGLDEIEQQLSSAIIKATS